MHEPPLPTSAAPGPAPDEVRALARELKTSVTLAHWLHRRGWPAGEATQRYLAPKLSHLTDPSEMADREVSASRIADAIRRGERICIFGDYDCDGVTSAAVMTEFIRKLGGEAVPLLATRREGAYGLCGPALQRILSHRPGLLITCDCGSSDHERIADAKREGVDTVVIDHHLVPDEPLPAVGFLNPHRPECGFPYKGLASVGLALSMGAALRKALGKELDVRTALDLVAIGTIADVAPLDGDNRALVRAGLGVLARTDRPGLRALFGHARISPNQGLWAEDIGYRIAPRLNAPGRMADPDEALRLLITRDFADAEMVAAAIEAHTSARKELQARTEREAHRQIEALGLASGPGLVLADEGWHPGIVGIVAGRIADKYGKPTIVIALEGERGRGSVRGPAGFPLYDALCGAREALRGFGGHQAAAGVDVDKKAVSTLRDAFDDACKKLGADRFGAVVPVADVVIEPDDSLYAVARDLERLEPCGEKNPAPRVLLQNVRVDRARDLKGHLKLELEAEQGRLSAIRFDLGAQAAAMQGLRVDLVGCLKRDRYRGGDAVEIAIDTMTPRAAGTVDPRG